MYFKATKLVTIICAAIFILIILLLHVIKPELDPTWRVVSEYEIGQYGWLMQISFCLLALASVSLAIGLWRQLSDRLGRIGRIWMLISAIGMMLGGIFITDPITTARNAWTLSGMLHNTGGSIMIFSTPIIASLIGASLLKSYSVKKRDQILIISMTTLIWVALISYIVISAITYHGIADASVVVGWPNRIFIIAYSLWLISIAATKLDLRKSRSSGRK